MLVALEMLDGKGGTDGGLWSMLGKRRSWDGVPAYAISIAMRTSIGDIHRGSAVHQPYNQCC